jgi:hypothetical protein
MNPLHEIVSERGIMLLCLNNFKYYKQTILKSGKEKWQCENKKYSAVLKTISSGKSRLITFQRIEHTHHRRPKITFDEKYLVMELNER